MAVLKLLAATLLFHIADPRIDEASGVAVGMASPGVVYVQNDGGDTARFFALDARTGATRAAYAVPGATNVDWEDIAVARDRRGVPSVWLADIGDNDGTRREIEIYRVDEPHGSAVGRPEVWRLRYPDGPHDAEALAVAPGGTAYIVTKSILGRSKVYAMPRRPGGVQTLRPVGDIDVRLTGTPGGPNIVSELTVTGASFSHDGTVFAVRTYTDAYVWRVRGGNLAGALRGKPVRIALLAQPQGEGIAVDGARLVIDTEGRHGAVYTVPLPAPATTNRTPTPSSTPSATPPVTPSATPSATPPVTPSATPTGDDDEDGRDPFPIGIAAAALAAVAALGLWLRRRRHP